jgi:hypothetical protein
MISIKVVDSSGNSISGADVQISWRGYTHSTGRTDSSGRISWDVSSGSGTIYVEGKEVYEGEISGSMTVQSR